MLPSKNPPSIEDCDDYWVLEIGAVLGAAANAFRVSNEVAEYVWTAVQRGEPRFLEFYDTSNSRCYYPLADFHGLYESTVDQRQHGMEHQKRVDDESPKSF